MSCIHIRPPRRGRVTGPSLRWLSPKQSEKRERGIRANAVHPNPKIRAAAASSYAAPADILLGLASDTDEEVRGWVARNEHAPEEALVALTSDEDEKVRAYVAWNPHTPLDSIKLLVEDTSMVVSALAEQRLLADQR